MKKYILTLFTCLIWQNSHAIDDITLNDLQQKGLTVIMGELTGAGAKVSMQNLHAFILNDGILLKENCDQIIINTSNSPKVANIKGVVFANQKIDAQMFEGIIIKK